MRAGKKKGQRLAGQELIVERYAKRVNLLKTRLCSACARKEGSIPQERQCSLLPVTTSGDDCPYYDKAGRESLVEDSK